MNSWEQLKKALEAIPPPNPDDAAAVRRVLYSPPDAGVLTWDDVDIALAWSDGALAWAKKRYGEPLQPAADWKDEVVELVGKGEIAAEDARALWGHHDDLMRRIDAL